MLLRVFGLYISPQIISNSKVISPFPMLSRTFHCPAKLNLVLRVVGKINTGFHLLRSVVVPISLFDKLTVTTETQAGGQEGSVKCEYSVALERHLTALFDSFPNERGIVSALNTRENLAAKAADLLLSSSKYPRVRPDLEIQKNIPFCAGLGGGSSDAATTLLALNEMLNLGYSHEMLAGLGSKIGSDVPALVLRKPVLIYGVGQKWALLSPCREVREQLAKTIILLIKPPFSVPTPVAYKALARPTLPSDRTAENDTITPDDTSLSEIIRLGFYPRTDSGAAGLTSETAFPNYSHSFLEAMKNDFEDVLLRLYPGLLRVKHTLERVGANGTILAGSGSTFAGFFDDLESAEEGLFRAREELGDGHFYRVAKFLPVAEAVKGESLGAMAPTESESAT